MDDCCTRAGSIDLVRIRKYMGCFYVEGMSFHNTKDNFKRTLYMRRSIIRHGCVRTIKIVSELATSWSPSGKNQWRTLQYRYESQPGARKRGRTTVACDSCCRRNNAILGTVQYLRRKAKPNRIIPCADSIPSCLRRNSNGSTIPTCRSVVRRDNRVKRRNTSQHTRYPSGLLNGAHGLALALDSYVLPYDIVDKSPKVYTQLAREGVVLTQDSDNI